MGKPAARLGDTTAHGGSIVVGAPTVLIGGMPAARQGDMHVCPMLNPGVPPPPHVGMPITLGCPTVLICGMPAARMGDMAACSGPPDSILAGCPTVMIGEGGGGGGGAGPSGSAASAALAGGGVTSEVAEGHYLDVTFVDKAGKPIKGVKYKLKDPKGETSENTLQGQVKKTGMEQGSYEFELKAVTSAKWSVKDAEVGEKIKLQVETSGIDSGTPAKLEIYIRDGNFGDKLMATIESKIDGDKIQETWAFKVDDEYLKAQEKKDGGGYSAPLFYFLVRSADITGRSDMLRIRDWMELKILDDKGQPVASKKCRITFPSGEVREGTTNASGFIRIEKVPPGKNKIKIDIRD